MIDLEESEGFKGPEEFMLMEEIVKKHWGRWVAVKVVERDESGQPLMARVLSESPDRYKVRRDVAGEESVCIFYAGPIPRAGGIII